MERDEMINTLVTKYGWEKSECLPMSDYLLARNIQIKEQEAIDKIEELKKFNEQRPSLTDYKPNEEISLQDSLKYLQIGDVSDPIKLTARNNLRLHLGLEELLEEPKPTEMDFEALLLLDNWEIGHHIKAWLKKFKHSEQDRYRNRLEEMIGVRNLEIRRKQEDIIKWQKIQQEYEQIMQIPEKLLGSGGDMQINPDYKIWVEELKSFGRKLDYMEKGINSRTEKPNYSEDFKQINKDIKKLVKKHN